LVTPFAHRNNSKDQNETTSRALFWPHQPFMDTFYVLPLLLLVEYFFLIFPTIAYNDYIPLNPITFDEVVMD
jgi:quinol-cytochrome oxidoreductase complex cytochrome b subunit